MTTTTTTETTTTTTTTTRIVVEVDREKMAQQAEKDIASIRESLQPYGEEEE